jgi:hypothetical protein
MSLMQIDIPSELDKMICIEKARLGIKCKKRFIIFILKEYFKLLYGRK